MKKILITAGPTWVAIDSVRVISNVSSGQTGLLLANQAKKSGFDVTLLLGPVGEVKLDKRIKVIRYHFFGELKSILEKILKDKKFDVIIHAAAISDYEPIEKERHKIASNLDYLTLKLKRTPKLIPLIKKLSPESLFVMFKLEDRVSRYYLDKAKKMMIAYCANLVALNSIKPYRARIIGRQHIYPLLESKQGLAKSLFSLIKKELLIK